MMTVIVCGAEQAVRKAKRGTWNALCAQLDPLQGGQRQSALPALKVGLPKMRDRVSVISVVELFWATESAVVSKK